MKLATAALLMLAPPACAQVNADECTVITDGADRLACFDRLFSTPLPEVEPPVGTGLWEVEIETSQMDDSTSVFLWLDSTDDISGPYGQSGPMTLHLRCLENTTSVVVYFNEHFMSDLQGGGQVEYRIDTDPAKTVRMQESTSHEALGLWRGRDAIPWIEQLLEGDRLTLRAAPMNEGYLTASFDIRGLEAALDPLRESCGW